jgi:hypothetical protein
MRIETLTSDQVARHIDQDPTHAKPYEQNIAKI